MLDKMDLKRIVSIWLLLAMVMLIMPSVKAQPPAPHILRMFPAIGWRSQPYVGGYFDRGNVDPDHPYTTTTQVQITISFPNTNPAVIPSDNYIAGGMFLQGQDAVLDNTDYLFLASLSLDSSDTIHYNMAFYVDFEGDPSIPSLGWYQILWQNAIVLAVSRSTPVTLTMQWVGDYVQWLYTINGVTYTAASLNAPSLYSSTMLRVFYVGTMHRCLLPPASSWCYYYQFGIYSEYEILNSGWTVKIERPKYYDTSIGQLRCVYRAIGIQGLSSFTDHWWGLGGWRYDVRGRHYYSYTPTPLEYTLQFDYVGYPDYIEDGVLLWNHDPNAPDPPSTPSGSSSGYRWTTYTYQTSTFDPNGNNLRYQFDWGDGTSTWTGYYSSGATASASHSWGSIGAYPIRVRAQDTTLLYSEWSYDKRMNIINRPGNPCPTLFVWDGSEYTQIGVLDIHAESDTTFMQGIEPILLPEHHLYKLSLRELDQYTSHIDYVKLYAVDNDVQKHECHLVQAVHSELGQVEGLLVHDDSKRVDLSPEQNIDLKFTVPNVDEIGYFIFEINGYNYKP